MTDSNAPSLRMSRSTFNDWLRSGVRPLPLIEPAPADDDVIVQLLPKYAPFVASGRPVTALIDEVVAVAQLTPELTSSLGIWLRNLGEPWLPVRFFACENSDLPVTHAAAPAEPLAPEPLSAAVGYSEPAAAAAPVLAPAAVKDAVSAYRDDADQAATEQATAKKKNGGRSRSKATKKAKASTAAEGDANQSQLFVTTEPDGDDSGAKG